MICVNTYYTNLHEADEARDERQYESACDRWVSSVKRVEVSIGADDSELLDNKQRAIFEFYMRELIGTREVTFKWDLAELAIYGCDDELVLSVLLAASDEAMLIASGRHLWGDVMNFHRTVKTAREWGNDWFGHFQDRVRVAGYDGGDWE